MQELSVQLFQPSISLSDFYQSTYSCFVYQGRTVRWKIKDRTGSPFQVNRLPRIVSEHATCHFILKTVNLRYKGKLAVAWMELSSPLKVWAGSRRQSWVSEPPSFLFSHTAAQDSHRRACELWTGFVCFGYSLKLSPVDYELSHHQWRTTIRHSTGELQ